jgi:hypothetical protein
VVLELEPKREKQLPTCRATASNTLRCSSLVVYVYPVAEDFFSHIRISQIKSKFKKNHRHIFLRTDIAVDFFMNELDLGFNPMSLFHAVLSEAHLLLLRHKLSRRPRHQ